VVVVGNKSPVLNAAMENFKRENVKWWNLTEEETDETYLSLNYALKMLSVGPFVMYTVPGVEWNDLSHMESRLKQFIESGKDFEIDDDYNLSSLIHKRNAPLSGRYWSKEMCVKDTVKSWSKD
jgi:hypothetical protein